MRGDAEFEALPPKVRADIETAVAWMLEMDAAESPHAVAGLIAARYVATKAPGKRTGVSTVSIYRRYRAWRKAERDWRVLEKHKSLRKGPAQPLQAYDLTGKAARAYFARQGVTLAEWALARGFAVSAVQSAISGKRLTAKSQQVFDALADDMRGEPEGWHRTVTALRRELDEVKERTRVLEGRMIATQRKMPHWIGLPG